MQYGFVINLKRCIGCHSCTMACKQFKGTSQGVFYCYVSHAEEGEYPNAKLIHTPTSCMHCAEPICTKVCPTKASVKRNDGIVHVNLNRCIGCKSCIEACPYNVRTLLEKASAAYYQGKDYTPKEMADNKSYLPGKVYKCDMCFEKIEAGELPVCVQTCATKARVFGDLDDPNSEVSLILASDKYSEYKQLKAEFGTNPSVYYLPK